MTCDMFSKNSKTKETTKPSLQEKLKMQLKPKEPTLQEKLHRQFKK